jgi:hypothetical protein
MAGTALGHRALPASPLMMRRRKEEPMGRPPGAGIDREVRFGATAGMVGLQLHRQLGAVSRHQVRTAPGAVGIGRAYRI